MKLTLILALLGISSILKAQDWSLMAKRIVDQTVGVKAGDVVWIQCGREGLPLAENIAAEVHRKGGVPNISIDTEIAMRALYYDKPEINLSDFPDHLIEWLKPVDFAISIDPVERASIFKDVDSKRMALIGSNRAQILDALSTRTHFSEIVISLPSQETSEITGMDYVTYEKMHWAAANADYKKIEESGNKLKDLLKGASKVKLTTKEGTNITFSMGDRLVFADDGILSDDERNSKIMFDRYAYLPGGWMDFAPLESSVNGKVVISKSRCNFEPMKEISFIIKDGVIKNFKALEGNDCFVEQMEPHSGNKNTVSVFTLGLNPMLQAIQNDKLDFRPTMAAGYMTLNIGGNNSQYNGVVNASDSFMFPLMNVTLEVDGEIVVKEGKLMLNNP